jgi:hypothetical protein
MNRISYVLPILCQRSSGFHSHDLACRGAEIELIYSRRIGTASILVDNNN